MLATALKKEVAEFFIKIAKETNPGSPVVLWCIKVPRSGAIDHNSRVKHASFVQNTLVPNESEFLWAAYSLFEVERVNWEEQPYQVTLKADLDNILTTGAYLPLAPWY